MSFFVFDTETCYDNIIQLCWYVIDTDYQIIERNNYYVKPDGFYINNTHIHKIEHTTAVAKGIPLLYAIMLFEKSLEKYRPQYLVAHNINYDIRILNKAYDKLKIDKSLLNSIGKFCTMSKSKQILQLKNSKGSSKNPKLIEIYNYLNNRELNTPLESAHNAFYDVKYTCDVFKKLHLFENICETIRNI